MRLIRRIGETLAPAPRRLLLFPLDGDGLPAAFDRVEEDGAHDGVSFETAFEVRGRWAARPAFAVYADWVLAPDGDHAAFEQSRRDLFELRGQHIDGFFVDYLLRRVNDPHRFTVLGLYGDRAGLDLARGHPEIQAWAQANMPTQWGARDETGMRFFRVAGV